jgi:predicted Zn finger-like uncharacterized protein
MYTRCPSCGSTFRVGAALLRMAEGDVRCGHCSVVFNALPHLYDSPEQATTYTGARATDEAVDELPPGEPAPGSESLAEADPVGAAPADATLEFDVPEPDWQRYFIPAEPALPNGPRTEPTLGEDFSFPAPPEAGEHPAPLAPPQPAPAEVEAPRSLEEETADTDTWQAFLRETEAVSEDDAEPAFVIGDDAPNAGTPAIIVRREPPPAAPDVAPDDFEALDDAIDVIDGISNEEMRAAAADLAAPAPETMAAAPQDAPGPSLAPEAHAAEEDGEAGGVEPAAPEARTPAAESSGPGLGDAPAEVPVETPDATGTVLDWGPEPSFIRRQPRRPRHTGRWLAASVSARRPRAALARPPLRAARAPDPRYGEYIQILYERLGLPLYPAWPLDAYEIRGAKAIAENSRPGALDMLAEIAVSGTQPVGAPLLRVVLLDRWANAVASGIFSPEQYLAGTTPARVYAPGSLIPVTINLKDPGTTAHGYELDVCRADRHLGLQCKTARDPFRN